MPHENDSQEQQVQDARLRGLIGDPELFRLIQRVTHLLPFVLNVDWAVSCSITTTIWRILQFPGEI